MELIDLLYETGIKCPKDKERTEVTGIVTDSRSVKKGCVFVCLEGNHTDGHIYAAEAALKGASAVICQKNKRIPELSEAIPILEAEDCRAVLSRLASNLYGNPSTKIRMFGVTGTNGKTTVTHMIRAIQQEAGQSCGLIGTIGYSYLGTKLEADHTTPDAADLQALLQSMLHQGVSCCAMEVSSHGLCLHRVDDITFAYAAFTNLTGDHLDFHKTMEQYYQAKKRLFLMAQKAAVVNIDDEYGLRLYEELKAEKETKSAQQTGRLELVSCSMKDPDADVYLEPISATAACTSGSLFYRQRLLGQLRLTMAGEFALYNSLTAAALCFCDGVSFESIKGGLEKMKGVPGRFQLVENNRNMAVVVDYCHTPDALKNALQTARTLDSGRLICVFGCGGDRDTTKRPIMGGIAGRYSDFCIVTSDNPRTEDQKIIASQIQSGLQNTGCPYKIIEKRQEAIEFAIDMYAPGDIILIAGKGHESYQIIGCAKTYFNDYETAAALMI